VKAPFYTNANIQDMVNEVREYYPRAKALPVDVESIADLDLSLDLQPTPMLLEKADTDALLLPDWVTMLVDAGEFRDAKMENRLRFSIAHELGHYFLHKGIYQAATYKTIDEWVEFVSSVPQETWSWLERHADEFAGRLLVPEAELQQHYAIATKRLVGTEWEKTISWPAPVADAIAKSICPNFGVSFWPVRSAMKRHKLWIPAD
jgi:hypothetical protein